VSTDFVAFDNDLAILLIVNDKKEDGEDLPELTDV